MASIIISVTVVAIGVAVGLLRGGRFDALMSVRPRWWALLASGFVLHALAEAIDLPAAVSISVIGTFAMIVALAANTPAIEGAFVTAFGLTMNLVVLVLNGTVPVRFEALTESGVVETGTSRDQILSVGHLLELETPDTSLGFLGDVVPVGPLTSVISIGDLVTYAGVILIVSGQMAARRRTGVAVDELFGPDPADRATVLHDAAPLDSTNGNRPAADEPGVLVLADDPAIDLTDGFWADEPDDEGVQILGPAPKTR